MRLSLCSKSIPFKRLYTQSQKTLPPHGQPAPGYFWPWKLSFSGGPKSLIYRYMFPHAVRLSAAQYPPPDTARHAAELNLCAIFCLFGEWRPAERQVVFQGAVARRVRLAEVASREAPVAAGVDLRGCGLQGVIRCGKALATAGGSSGSSRSAALWRRWLRAKPPEIPWAFCALGHGQCIDRPICGRTVGDIIKRAIVKTRGARPQD